MKKALLIGINAYPNMPLSGCANDVRKLQPLLAHHGDTAKTPNFECRQILAEKDGDEPITRPRLRREVKSFFENEADTSLLYFSGHGFSSDLGGYLVTQDFVGADEGVPMQEILALANSALIGKRAKEVILILDCCFSGKLGGVKELGENAAMLAEGLTILAASRSYQFSFEAAHAGGGIFTNLLISALQGSAANVLGQISLGAAYSFVESMLGAWDQRPLFKCHVSKSSVVRQVEPLIELPILRKIREYFAAGPDAEYPLDPTYEEDKHHVPEGQREVNPQHEAIFADFRKYAAKNLLVPVGEEYLYWAAVRSKSCQLTETGKYIWQMTEKGRI